MVGPWPLAPHHDRLQYIHHIHLMQRGQNWDITVAGGIDHMGRVAKPETLEGAPRYEYNPRNISTECQ